MTRIPDQIPMVNKEGRVFGICLSIADELPDGFWNERNEQTLLKQTLKYPSGLVVVAYIHAEASIHTSVSNLYAWSLRN